MRQVHEEQIYDTTNKHGFFQTVLDCADGVFPVCSTCHCHVIENEGQGSICDDCLTDFNAHCAADYD